MDTRPIAKIVAFAHASGLSDSFKSFDSILIERMRFSYYMSVICTYSLYFDR